MVLFEGYASPFVLQTQTNLSVEGLVLSPLANWWRFQCVSLFSSLFLGTVSSAWSSDTSCIIKRKHYLDTFSPREHLFPVHIYLWHISGKCIFKHQELELWKCLVLTACLVREVRFLLVSFSRSLYLHFRKTKCRRRCNRATVSTLCTVCVTQSKMATLRVEKFTPYSVPLCHRGYRGMTPCESVKVDVRFTEKSVCPCWALTPVSFH